MSWFEKLTGFREQGFEETQRRLRVEDGWLYSDATQNRYRVGTLQMPTLGELRDLVGDLPMASTAKLNISCVEGDARVLHCDKVNRGALFQVASQFNLLEMVGPQVTPEDGVSRYAYDRTQGPACAIAAGAGTIFRNYLVDVDGSRGQRRDRQIDCLADVGRALGNEQGRLWQMRNGYALCSEQGLASVNATLEGMAVEQLDGIRTLLRIGFHKDVQVTDATDPEQLVSQCYCSALPVAYSGLPVRAWAPFATLVLEAMYEATLLAGVINAATSGSNRVFLTRVGGGAFGNDFRWIHAAIARAARLLRGADLDVRIVCYGQVTQDVRELVQLLQSEF